MIALSSPMVFKSKLELDRLGGKEEISSHNSIELSTAENLEFVQCVDGQGHEKEEKEGGEGKQAQDMGVFHKRYDGYKNLHKPPVNDSKKNTPLWVDGRANFVSWEGPTLAKFLVAYPEIAHLTTVIQQALWLQMSVQGRDTAFDGYNQLKADLDQMTTLYAKLTPLSEQCEKLREDNHSSEAKWLRSQCLQAKTELEERRGSFIERMKAEGMLDRAQIGVLRDHIAPWINIPLAAIALANKKEMARHATVVGGHLKPGPAFLGSVAPKALAGVGAGVGIAGNLVHIVQSYMGLKNLGRRGDAVSRQKMRYKQAALQSTTPLMQRIIDRGELIRKGERHQIDAGKFLEWARALQWNGPAAAANIALIVGAATGTAAVATFATPVALAALAGFLLIGSAQIAWRTAKAKQLVKDKRTDPGRDDAREVVKILRDKKHVEHVEHADTVRFVKTLGVPGNIIDHITESSAGEDELTSMLEKQLYQHSALDPTLDQQVEWALRAAGSWRILKKAHQDEKMMALMYLAGRLGALKYEEGMPKKSHQDIRELLSKVGTKKGAQEVRELLKLPELESDKQLVKPRKHWTYALGTGNKAGDLGSARKYSRKDFDRFWQEDAKETTGFRFFIRKTCGVEADKAVSHAEYLRARAIGAATNKLLSSPSQAWKIIRDYDRSWEFNDQQQMSVARLAAGHAIKKLNVGGKVTRDSVVAHLAVHQVRARVETLVRQGKPLDSGTMNTMQALVAKYPDVKDALYELVQTSFDRSAHWDVVAPTRQFADRLAGKVQGDVTPLINAAVCDEKLRGHELPKIIASLEKYPRKPGITDAVASTSAKKILKERLGYDRCDQQQKERIDAAITFAAFVAEKKAIIGAPTLGNALRLRTWDLSADGKVLEQLFNAMSKGQPHPRGIMFSPKIIAAALMSNDESVKSFMNTWLQENGWPSPQATSEHACRHDMEQIARFEKNSSVLVKALQSKNEDEHRLAETYLTAKLPVKLKENWASSGGVVMSDSVEQDVASLIARWKGRANNESNEADLRKTSLEIDLLCYNKLTVEKMKIDEVKHYAELAADDAAELAALVGLDAEENVAAQDRAENKTGDDETPPMEFGMTAFQMTNPLSALLFGSVERRAENLAKLLAVPGADASISNVFQERGLTELADRLTFYAAALQVKDKKQRAAHLKVIQKEAAWMMAGKKLKDMPVEVRLSWSPDFLESCGETCKDQVDEILTVLSNHVNAKTVERIKEDERQNLLLQLQCLQELEGQDQPSNKLKMLSRWTQKYLKNESTKPVVAKVIRNCSTYPDGFVRGEIEQQKWGALLKNEWEQIDALAKVKSSQFDIVLAACIAQIEEGRRAAIFGADRAA